MMLDRSSRVVSKAAIPEGHTYLETFTLLSQATNIPVADFQAAAKDPIALGIPDWWFNRSDKKQSIVSIEGFLWPDTYEFNPNLTAAQILKQIVAQFMKVAESMDFVKTAEGKHVSPFAALITASLYRPRRASRPTWARSLGWSTTAWTSPCPAVRLDHQLLA